MSLSRPGDQSAATNPKRMSETREVSSNGPKDERRRHALRILIQSNRATSQAWLLKELRAIGFEVTQATVSRDLYRLGAGKIKADDGTLVYSLPEGRDRSSARAHLFASLHDQLIEATAINNFVVIKTLAGHAGGLAADIDEARLDNMVATLAGNDTIFVICRDESDAITLSKLLNGALATE